MRTPSNHELRPAARGRGFALILTLACVVLMTVLVVAFFSQSTLNRRIAFSSAAMQRADMLARAAQMIVVGEIRQEIADGPLNDPDSNVTSRPQRVGVDIASLDVNGAYTLVKVSADGQPISIYADSTSTIRATSVSTEASSTNSRSMNGERWFGAGGPDLGSQDVAPNWMYVTRGSGVKTPSSNGAADANSPDYVTGRFAYTVYDISGRLDANVAGYPESGAQDSRYKSALSDIDLSAIRPSGSTTGSYFDAMSTQKFLSWRQGADAPAGGASPNYQNYVNNFGAPHGFLAVKENHNAICSRRDLLNAAAASGPNLIPGDVVPYLTNFSRSVTTPSWSAFANSVDIPNSRETLGTPINYKDDADNSASINRNLAGVTFGVAATVKHYDDEGRLDPPAGRQVQIGDPVFERRFSLAKLAWLGREGPNATVFNASLTSTQRNQAIRDCFGLQWNASEWRWDYVELPSSGKHIYTPAEIAAQNREPNFFETLRAGILSGSLGRDPGGNVIGDFNDTIYNYKKEPDLHVIQIGANMIDQADEDSYPTAIYAEFFSGMSKLDQMAIETAYGIENLPYLTRVGPLAAADPVPTATENGMLHYWIQPELWNPHQASPEPISVAPTNFRFYAYGSAKGVYRRRSGTQTPHYSNPVYYDDGDDNNGTEPNVTDGAVYFSLSDPGGNSSPFYGHPQLLIKSLVDSTQTQAINLYDPAKFANLYDDNGKVNEFAAVYSGLDPDYPLPPSGSGGWTKFAVSNPRVYYSLHYRRSDGSWSPYTFMARLNGDPTDNLRRMTTTSFSAEGGVHWAPNNPSTGAQNGIRAFGRVDPRTDRFSVFQNWVRDWSINQTFDSSPGNDVGNNFDSLPLASGGLSPFVLVAAADSTNSTKLANLWAVNDPNSAFMQSRYGSYTSYYYADRDGVVRFGDGFLANTPNARWADLTPPQPPRAPTGDGCQLYHSTEATGSAVRRRPIILNRPFRSVGELGFVFRDLPLKSLDLWTPTSPDGALLDLFAITDEPLLVAGRINPNAAPPEVLKAVFNGAMKNTKALPDSEATISDADAQRLADATVTSTRAEPFRDRAGIARRYGEIVKNEFQTIVAGPESNWANKAHAESPTRALSNVSDINTWNLMIDTVAQTGTVRKGGNLVNFTVEGEQRYWLFVAIDRATGRVVEQKLEPVYE